MDENIKEVIERISCYSEDLPKDDLQFLIDNQEKSTPFLLEVLENREEVLEKMIDDRDYILPVNALFLLAQFREKRAYPLAVEVFSADKDVIENAFDDFTKQVVISSQVL